MEGGLSSVEPVIPSLIGVASMLAIIVGGLAYTVGARPLGGRLIILGIVLAFMCPLIVALCHDAAILLHAYWWVAVPVGVVLLLAAWLQFKLHLARLSKAPIPTSQKRRLGD